MVISFSFEIRLALPNWNEISKIISLVLKQKSYDDFSSYFYNSDGDGGRQLRFHILSRPWTGATLSTKNVQVCTWKTNSF